MTPPASQAPTTCVVADNHPAVRAGLSAHLQTLDNLEVVGEASTGFGTVELLDALRPCVALVNLRLADGNGIDVLRGATDHSIATPIIIMSAVHRVSMVREALDAGARGFLSEDAEFEAVTHAVRAVSSGGTYIDPTIARELFAPRPSTLSDRELEVLQRLADGEPNKLIASGLQMSEDTVKRHVSRILGKLGTHSRAGAVAEGFRQQLLH